MLSKTHKLTELITHTLGPIFREHSDYPTILQAMSLVMARVAQATPDIGQEIECLDTSYCIAKDALVKFIELEEQIKAGEAAKKAKLESGINGFDQFAEPKPAIEEGSSSDYPDNLPKFSAGEAVSTPEESSGQ